MHGNTLKWLPRAMRARAIPVLGSSTSSRWRDWIYSCYLSNDKEKQHIFFFLSLFVQLTIVLVPSCNLADRTLEIALSWLDRQPEKSRSIKCSRRKNNFDANEETINWSNHVANLEKKVKKCGANKRGWRSRVISITGKGTFHTNHTRMDFF